MIRVVLDTNIVVSALLQPLGPPAQVFLLVLGNAVQMCISGRIFAEYEEVLRRPKFRFADETIRSALETIRRNAHWVRPGEPVRVCLDPDDDIFLECCQASSAGYLVTGNLSDFPVQWLGTQVVSPRSFLEITAIQAK